MRRHLLKWAPPGPVYVPFIGDGDIAAGLDLGSATRASSGIAGSSASFLGLYMDRYVYGADLDPARVKVAQARIPNGNIRVADCDIWPFYDIDTPPIVVADFDAWAEPWPSFRAFWKYANKADKMVLFFTDAHRMGVMVDGTHISPDGSKREISNLTERRKVFHFYLSQYVWPWFEDYIQPYVIVDRMRYLRGMLTYWGCAIERKDKP